MTNTNESQLKMTLKTFGPGIITASAAIGGSHLVSSTQAGSLYGWQLLGLVLLINVLKYPFFLQGVQYTMATGESLQSGYEKLGKVYLWVFNLLNWLSAVLNTAALLIFAAVLLHYFLPFNTILLAVLLLVVSIAVIMKGHYHMLSTVSKVIVSVLSVLSLVILFIAMSKGGVAPADYVAPSPWTLATVPFLVALMGWMPMPIELSAISSLWLLRQCDEQKMTMRTAERDFNVGYIGTIVLAVVFLSLGAFTLFGSGVDVNISSGVGYTKQLVQVYVEQIGAWSQLFVALLAFCCIYGSLISVLDGYSRVLAEGVDLVLKHRELSLQEKVKHFNIIVLLVSVVALGFVALFQGALGPLLRLAMILSFITTPIFAVLNFKLSSRQKGSHSKKWQHILALCGLTYLYGFLLFFLWTLFL